MINGVGGVKGVAFPQPSHFCGLRCVISDVGGVKGAAVQITSKEAL